MQLHALEAPGQRGFDQFEQVRLQAHHDRLCFRIAEAHVEFDHTGRAMAVDHQARVKKADERRAFGGHAGEGRPDHLVHDATVDLGADHGCRRIGAHAAGVGAGVRFADPLVVLAGRHRQRGVAIGDNDVAGFLAFEEFLDDDARPGIAQGLRAEHVVQGLFGIAKGQCHDDALAGSESVRLDHDRRADLAHVSQSRLERAEYCVACRRDVVAEQKGLGIRLGTFELGGDPARPETGQALGTKAVDQAEHQRRLRSDHSQIDPLGMREPQQAIDVGDRHFRIAHARLARGSGIAGRNDHLADAFALGQFPGQRMFTTASTYDEEFHFESRDWGFGIGDWIKQRLEIRDSVAQMSKSQRSALRSTESRIPNLQSPL